MEVRARFTGVKKIKCATETKVDPETGDKSVNGKVSFSVDDVNVPSIAKLVHLQKITQPVDLDIRCGEERITFDLVNNLGLSTEPKISEDGVKSVVGTISFKEEDIADYDVAAIVRFQKSDKPVDVEVRCLQAVMDFHIQALMETGELKEVSNPATDEHNRAEGIF